jgi:CheY-like chemotaxis protein
VMMVGDPDRLQQVMWNLLSNAVKFTPKGGRIEVAASRETSQVELQVSDTGIGVAPEFLPHLFERFTQAESSRNRRYGGLGLGLAIVRHVVELHGGTVHATSAGEGQGATFTVTLPITAVVPETIAKVAGAGPEISAPESIATSLVGVRVLAVDDDADSLQVLQTILAGNGATVVVAGSAGAGMDTLLRFRPDVLISDIGMPGMDGYGFIRNVRALSQEDGGRTPAIALTAYGQSSDRRDALAAGFDEHLSKPVTPQELVRAVAAIMRPMTPPMGDLDTRPAG